MHHLGSGIEQIIRPRDDQGWIPPRLPRYILINEGPYQSHKFGF